MKHLINGLVFTALVMLSAYAIGNLLVSLPVEPIIYILILVFGVTNSILTLKDK